ncbi:F-box domain, cyclin-like protein [Artemisia annua]|uniref:F-box domain, cyclin-like protein n=1 Tax=Artemisia annua TaxID=35608 RepID=A0A2U1Q5P3_ARTAN|nr:F-box domain, cyclin-like protein [Artemisia annua]
MKKQKIVEDGYGPSEDEDDDYYNYKKVGVLKDVTKKRKMIKKTSLEYKKEEYLQDPLVVFGWDIMLKILNHLDARSVALSLMVSRGWHGVASSDAIWSKKLAVDLEGFGIFVAAQIIRTCYWYLASSCPTRLWVRSLGFHVLYIDQ